MGYTREIELLQQSWAAQPDSLHFAPLAELLRKDGQLERALEVLRVGLSRNPRHIPGYVVRGRCYRDPQRYPEAEAAYRQALALEPGQTVALHELAELNRRTGQR